MYNLLCIAPTFWASEFNYLGDKLAVVAIVTAVKFKRSSFHSAQSGETFEQRWPNQRDSRLQLMDRLRWIKFEQQIEKRSSITSSPNFALSEIRVMGVRYVTLSISWRNRKSVTFRAFPHIKVFTIKVSNSAKILCREESGFIAKNVLQTHVFPLPFTRK